jgi:hypothetical protein
MMKDDPWQELVKAAEAVLREQEQTNLTYGVREGASPLAPWPSQPARIVFLDFDGVLNSHQSALELGTRYRFAPACVSALNSVLHQSGAHIVITSSWRQSFTLRENAQFLERDGVVPGRVVGQTPWLERERGAEINAWLQNAPFPISGFVILDDREDMMMHGQRLIRVNPSAGLSTLHVRRALALLKTPWPESKS